MKQPKNFFEKIRDGIIHHSFAHTDSFGIKAITNYEYKVSNTSSIPIVSPSGKVSDASELWLMPDNEASKELGYCLRLRIYWEEERIDTIRPKVGEGTVHSTVWTRSINRDDILSLSHFGERVLVSLLESIIINPK